MLNSREREREREPVPSDSTTISGKQRWLPQVLLIQVVLVVAFLSVNAFQPYITTWVSARVPDGLHQFLQPAFQRYTFAICITGLLVCVYFLLQADDFIQLDKRKRSALIGALSLLAYTTVFLRALQFPIGEDDSFIDYRYIRNWLDGAGFDYNPGERVLGFTSHFHLLVVWLGALLSRSNNVIVVAQMINLLAQLLTLGLGFKVLRLILKSEWYALSGCALLTFSPMFVDQTAFGKELPIVDFLILLSIYAITLRRWTLLAWASNLLFMSRPEGAIWLSITAIYSFAKDKFKVMKAWLPPLVLSGAVYCGLLAYFGTFLPHGGIAKAVMYPDRPFGECNILIMETIAAYANLTPFNIHRTIIDRIVSIIIGVILLFLALLNFRQEALRLYIWNAMVLILIFFAANTKMFSWYYCWFALIPFFLLPMLEQKLLGNIKKGPIDAVKVLAASYLLIAPMVMQPSLLEMTCYPIFHDSHFKHRLVRYVECAHYLEEQLPLTVREKISVATAEPGMFGYSYHGKIIDLGGLVSNGMFKYYPVPKAQRAPGTDYSVPASAIYALEPEYVLFCEPWGINGILSDKKFEDTYTRDKTWDVDKQFNVTLFRRRDFKPPGE
jgi:hypothetical protein